MPRQGDGVYDEGNNTGGIKGMPQGQAAPNASKAPTGRPNVGGNPLSKDANAAAQKGLDDAKRNDRA